MSTNPDPSPAGDPVFQRLDRSAAYPYAPGEYVRRFAWAAVERTLFRLSPPRAFRWRAALLRLAGARIGRRTRIARTVTLVHPWLLDVGDWSSLGAGVRVYNLGMVRVGAHAAVSQGAHLCGGTHDHRQPDLPLVRATVTIGDGAWVAAEAFVGPGVTVGRNAVVGARAVVTADVPPGMVVAGNPARVIKARLAPGSQG